MPHCKRPKKPSKQGFRYLRLIGLVLSIAAAVLAGAVMTRLAIAQHRHTKPQAILILDGNNPRVWFGAIFAKRHPGLPVWISGYCSHRQAVRRAFAAAGVVNSRVRYDLRATDTVTHFTTLVKDFVEKDIRHVYVVTSDYHMVRVQAITAVVFGSHGIVMTPVIEPTNLSSQKTRESWVKVGRDTLRSFLWLVVGRTGAHFNGRQQEGCNDSSLAD